MNSAQFGIRVRQECRPCEPGKMQPAAGQMSCFDCLKANDGQGGITNGVDCGVRDAILVRRGYYTSELLGERTAIYRCPWEDVCLGEVAGNASCALGHEGPLCGTCQPNFYRASRECKSCGDTAGGGQTSRAVVESYVLSSLVLVVGTLIAVSYLLTGRIKSKATNPKEAQSASFLPQLLKRTMGGARVVRFLLGY